MCFLPINPAKAPSNQDFIRLAGMNNRIWPVFLAIFKLQCLMLMSLFCHDICVTRMLRRTNEN